MQLEPGDWTTAVGSNEDEADSARNIAGLVVAAVALSAFFISLLVLGEGRRREQRDGVGAMDLFGGIEAVAFAATGWIFGREVNRAAVAQSQKQAKEAQDEAKAQRERAVEAVTSGKRMRDSIIAKAGIARSSMDAAPTGLQELAALAQKAFPD